MGNTRTSLSKTGFGADWLLRLRDLLPYAGFYIISVCAYFDLSVFSASLAHGIDFGKAIGLALVALGILFNLRNRVRYYLLCGTGIAIGMLVWAQAGVGYLFWAFTIAASMRDADPKKLAMALMAAIVTAFVALQVSLLVTGVSDSVIRRSGDGAFRRCFGFQHPNYVGMLGTAFASGAFLLYWDSNRLVAVLLGLLPVIPAALADSRTGLVGIAFFCIGSAVLTNADKKAYVRLRAAAPWVFVACVILSLLSMLFYSSDNSLLAVMNKLLSGRLHLNNYYFELYGLSPFGRKFDVPSGIWSEGIEVSFLVDNAYCRLLIQYGVIAAVIFAAYYLSALIGWSKRGARDGVVVIAVVYAVVGLSEHMMFDPSFNISLLMLPSGLAMMIEGLRGVNGSNGDD